MKARRHKKENETVNVFYSSDLGAKPQPDVWLPQSDLFIYSFIRHAIERCQRKHKHISLL